MRISDWSSDVCSSYLDMPIVAADDDICCCLPDFCRVNPAMSAVKRHQEQAMFADRPTPSDKVVHEVCGHVQVGYRQSTAVQSRSCYMMLCQRAANAPPFLGDIAELGIRKIPENSDRKSTRLNSSH